MTDAGSDGGSAEAKLVEERATRLKLQAEMGGFAAAAAWGARWR